MFIRFLFLTVFVVSSFGHAHASATPEQTKKEAQLIIKMIDDGDIAGALDSARLVETWLLEMMASDITKVFGDYLDWTKEIQDSQASGNAFLGGIGATCKYISPDGLITATVTILGNSPLFGMVSGMFQNSFILSASGGRVTRLEESSKKAVVQKEGSKTKIMVTCPGNTLVTGECENEQHAIGVTNVVDYDSLESIVSTN